MSLLVASSWRDASRLRTLLFWYVILSGIAVGMWTFTGFLNDDDSAATPTVGNYILSPLLLIGTICGAVLSLPQALIHVGIFKATMKLVPTFRPHPLIVSIAIACISSVIIYCWFIGKTILTVWSPSGFNDFMHGFSQAIGARWARKSFWEGPGGIVPGLFLGSVGAASAWRNANIGKASNS